MKAHVKNWEIAVYALHLEGGASTPVRTEDVALKCFEIVPEAFSWIHHTQYPDKDIARVALSDARKPKAGALVKGRAGKGHGRGKQSAGSSSGDGWMLTEAGVRWVLANEQRVRTSLEQEETRFHRQDVLQKLKRFRQSPLFLGFVRSPAEFQPSLGQLAELMRCRVDADEGVWSKRIEAVRNQALLVKHEELVQFISLCESRILELIHRQD